MSVYQTDLSQHVHYFLDLVSTFSPSLSLPLSLFLSLFLSLSISLSLSPCLALSFVPYLTISLNISSCVYITLSISFSPSQYIVVSGVGFAASTQKSGPFGRVSSAPSGERKTDYEGNEKQAD